MGLRWIDRRKKDPLPEELHDESVCLEKLEHVQCH